MSIRRLYSLQELDWEISSRESLLGDVRSKLADDSAVESARRGLADLAEQIRKQGSARQLAELAVQPLGDRLQVIDDRLYSGAVKSQRELEAYIEEKNHLQRQRGAEEDGLLELMVQVEDLQSQRSRAETELSALEACRMEDRPRLLAEENRLVNGLEALKRERTSITPDIPQSSLLIYDTLIKSRSGHAVAKVERGLCQGCRIASPTTDLQRARASSAIVQCNNCHRILYVV